MGQELKWFEFDQNNTGGSFTVNDKLCHRVFIEAENTEIANQKALDLGIYFDGCSEGNDCPCCGDRWYPADEAVFLPVKYGKDIEFDNINDYAQYLAKSYGWTTPDTRLYYDSGVVVSFDKDNR